MIGMLGGTKAMNTKKFLWSDSQISTGTPATSWNVDSGAKVIVSPGWWPDNKTTPTYWRTNQTAASFTVKVSGTACFGICMNANGMSHSTGRPGVMVARKSTTELGLYASTTYSIGHVLTQGTGGHYFYTDLVPATTYYIQVITTLPPDMPDADCTLETHRQPTIGSTGADSGLGSRYAFCEVSGFIGSPGMTFSTVTFANTRKKFYIIGDSNCEGRLATAAGTKNYSAYSHDGLNFTEHRALFFTGEVGAGTQDWDIYGVTKQWFWTLIQTFCVANNYIPIIMNNSAGGMWQTKMGTTQRNTWAAIWPGVYENFETRFKYRGNTNATDFTVVGDWTGGWSPNCVIISSGYNNYIQNWWERSDGGNIGGGSSAEFSTNQKANLGSTSSSLIQLIRAQWVSVPVFVGCAQATDAIWGNPPVNSAVPLTAFAQFKAGVNNTSGAFYQFAATGTDYVANTGRFYDFSSLIGTAGIADTFDADNSLGTGQPHMNATQHEACRSAAQSTFNALAI